MRIEAFYSHLNGKEYLLVHKEDLWEELVEVIHEVDAESCKTKISKEQRSTGRALYSPREMNRAFKKSFVDRCWAEERNAFWVTHDRDLLAKIYHLPGDEQKRRIEEAGYTPIGSYNQTDFVKEGVSVEVQFGKYAFVAHDLFVKHLGLYVSGTIDVGIEILPMKSMEKEMSSGVPYYERDLFNIIRQGRGVPAVPLVLIGVIP